MVGETILHAYSPGIDNYPVVETVLMNTNSLKWNRLLITVALLGDRFNLFF